MINTKYSFNGIYLVYSASQEPAEILKVSGEAKSCFQKDFKDETNRWIVKNWNSSDDEWAAMKAALDTGEAVMCRASELNDLIVQEEIED